MWKTLQINDHANYEHAKGVWNNFLKKDVGEYYDLNVQSDYLHTYSKVFAISVLKYMSWLKLIFMNNKISMASMFKKGRNRIRIIIVIRKGKIVWKQEPYLAGF